MLFKQQPGTKSDEDRVGCDKKCRAGHGGMRERADPGRKMDGENNSARDKGEISAADQVEGFSPMSREGPRYDDCGCKRHSPGGDSKRRGLAKFDQDGS